jgi:tetratricopeptide (TPR) repeat protein
VAIARGLEKDPGKRWQTGAAFAEAMRGDSPAARTAQRSSNRRLAMVAGGVLAAAAAIGIWYGASRGDSGGNSFLVAPFEIQSGDQSVAWLREGSVNMLTLTLGQWSDLNVVDYERTLSLLDAEELGDKERLSAEDAFALARRAGASRVVTGQVLTTADSLIVVAKLYDVASRESNQQAQASIARGSDPRPLFDQLGRKLLDIQGFTGQSTVQLAQATTSSLAAYRAFLDGVKLLNSWRLPEADSAFGRAIALDSTFALAYHKRALGLGWSATGGADYNITSRKAFELMSRLPPRERSLVAGHHHLVLALAANAANDTVTAGREYTASIKAYRELIDPPRGDSLVAEAWYGLADAYFHARLPNATRGQIEGDLARSLRGFHKTLAIDSTYHLAYSHLVQLYNNAATGQGPLFIGDSAMFPDSATVVRLGQARVEALRGEARQKGIEIAKAWARADDESSQPFYQLAQSYNSAGFPDSAIAVLREALARPRSGAALARLSLLTNEEMASDTGAAGTLDYILDRYTPDSLRPLATSARFQQQASLLSSAALQGRASDIERAAKLYEETDPTLPFVRASSAPMIDYFRIANRLAAGDSMTPAHRRALLGAQKLWMDSLPPQLRNTAKFGLGSVPYMAFLMTHDTAFKRQATEWRGGGSTPFTELDAILALDKGDTATAMAIAQRFSPPDSLRRARFGTGSMRTIARAEVLARLGMTRRAAETYEAIDLDRVNRTGLIEPGLAVWVRTLVEQARLWQQLGEREKAIAAYEEFLRRWKNADGPAERLVAQARAALAALRDSPSGR